LHPQALEAMSSKAKQLGHSDAAQVIVEDCYRLLGVDI